MQTKVSGGRRWSKPCIAAGSSFQNWMWGRGGGDRARASV